MDDRTSKTAQPQAGASRPDPAHDPAHGPALVFFSGGTALRETARQLIRHTHNATHIITSPDPTSTSRSPSRSTSAAAGEPYIASPPRSGQPACAGGFVV